MINVSMMDFFDGFLNPGGPQFHGGAPESADPADLQVQRVDRRNFISPF